ncbi:MAG TPA: DUF4126 domain-containing protein [Patescibacteria group bacterium]|nr:DUF4126 domain-containing protein [Patescibacteria group bacterium]
MDAINSISVLLGSSWASGLNLYLTTASLGIMNRLHWIKLPGEMNGLSHPLVIGVAVLMYLVEFVADKIPYVDSAWDAVHTFIRPAGGAIMGFMSTAHMGSAVQIPVALLTGSVAASSHLTKATTRVAINTSPEPFTNSIASVTEDGAVIGILWLVVRHPIIAAIVVVTCIALSIWLLCKMFKFLKKVFTGARKKEEAAAAA